MIIKICGLRRPEDIAMANEFRPEYIGFVFAKSKRQVTREQVAELKNALSKDIQAVGVFVDEDINKVAALANDGIIDLIQLHGKEDETYIRKLREMTQAKIIQAVRLGCDSRSEIIINSEADYILLDSGAGSGETFDWKRKVICNKPIFLAGGLNPENVARAIRQVNPMAVDVSSGVETDGYKDIDKIRRFIAECRR